MLEGNLNSILTTQSFLIMWFKGTADQQGYQRERKFKIVQLEKYGCTEFCFG